jgi:predicted KAP-like P-loop ATPase
MDQLSADSPITTRNEDALDYWPFAESLAKGLTQRIPRDGFVVGVQARWGMGKNQRDKPDSSGHPRARQLESVLSTNKNTEL